jgi:hypothetical protein
MSVKSAPAAPAISGIYGVASGSVSMTLAPQERGPDGRGDRTRVRQQACSAALNWTKRTIQENPRNLDLSMPQNLIKNRLVGLTVKFFRPWRNVPRSRKTRPPGIGSWRNTTIGGIGIG